MDLNYDNWTIVRKLGTGSFGSVYEIEREDYGVYKAALKVISIPTSPDEIADIRSSGMSDQSISNYYSNMVKDIVSEFALMSQLKGTTNIVSYEDHKVIPHEDGIGFDIYIRMELLTPLDKYMQDHVLDEKDVARLGIDICRALERCQRMNILHRDIKPANIFISDQGDFKLGDFGIARTMNRTVSNMSRKGTTNYMAPEVYNGSEYGRTVDIYSLGLVMYRLLNHNRMPFMPSFPDPINYKDQELAHIKRITGTPIPYPNNEVTPLGSVILKACAFDPTDRFQTPSAFRHALEQVTERSSVLDSDVKDFSLMPKETAAETSALSQAFSANEPLSGMEIRSDDDKLFLEAAAATTKPGASPSASETVSTDVGGNKKKSSHKAVWIIAAIAAVVIVAVLLILFLPKRKPMITIENYLGKTASAIQPQLEESGLSVTVEETDGTEAAGMVLKQSLPAGTEAEEGASIVFTVSKGNLVVIPAFKNQPRETVESALKELGLNVEVAESKRLFDENVTAENVVRIYAVPAEDSTTGSTEVNADASAKRILKEGDLVEKTSSVKVYLCGVKIPENIVGNTEAAATALLTEQGFQVNIIANNTTNINDNDKVANVLNSNGTKVIKPGTVLKKGTTVSLTVNHYVQPYNPAPVYTPPANYQQEQPVFDSNVF